jgi:hypothetical protein
MYYRHKVLHTFLKMDAINPTFDAPYNPDLQGPVYPDLKTVQNRAPKHKAPLNPWK